MASEVYALCWPAFMAQARIGIVGLGYVGLPLAAVFATSGYPVLGFDIDAAKSPS